MRNVADGRIKWGFWPPESEIDQREGRGIWLENHGLIDDGEENDKTDIEDDLQHGVENDDDDLHDKESLTGIESGQHGISSDGALEEDEDEYESEEEDEITRNNVNNFFAALNGDVTDTDEEEESDVDSELPSDCDRGRQS